MNEKFNKKDLSDYELIDLYISGGLDGSMEISIFSLKMFVFLITLSFLTLFLSSPNVLSILLTLTFLYIFFKKIAPLKYYSVYAKTKLVNYGGEILSVKPNFFFKQKRF